MDRSIQSIEWRRSNEASTTDVTNAIEEGVVCATPHPDDAINEPKGYSIQLTLAPDSDTLAAELQEALLDIDPARITLHLDDVERPIRNLPVSVSKVPYPGDQNVAELGVPPEGHDQLHPHFHDD